MLAMLDYYMDRQIKKMINKLAKWLTLFIYPKKERQLKRSEWIRILRNRIYGQQVLKRAKSIGKEFMCNNFSRVTKNTVIKDFCGFNGMTILGKGNVEIGNYFHSGTDCTIMTTNHNYESTLLPYDSTSVDKDVKIGDCVWFGSKVTILPGTTIEDGAIIQAGSVVHGHIPYCAIAGGNPAKVFKYRDVEHYEELKSKNLYHTIETLYEQRNNSN